MGAPALSRIKLYLESARIDMINAPSGAKIYASYKSPYNQQLTLFPDWLH